MAMATGRAHCVTCGKERAAYKCEGCSQYFCITHLPEHHKIVGKQLDDIENKRNIFRQSLTEQKVNPEKHSLMQQINKWERDSIQKIQQAAEEARELLFEHTYGHIEQIEIKLDEFAKQLKQTRQENDFNEIILNELKQKLQELEEELVKPPNISIGQDSSAFINKIAVVIASSKY